MTTSPAKKAAPPRRARAQTTRTVRPVQFQTADAEPAKETAPAPTTEPAIDTKQIDTTEASSTAEPADDTTHDGPPKQVNGIDVVREEILFALSEKAPFRYSRLHLANDSTCFTCRDCWDTAATRGEIMQHRSRTHGSRYGRRKPKIDLPAAQGVLDLVLEPRADGEPAPDNPLDWSLREWLALLPTIAALGNLVDQLETERDAARAELASTRVVDKAAEHKIAMYDVHRQEILELRRWKKDMIKRLSPLGFKFEEDEGE